MMKTNKKLKFILYNVIYFFTLTVGAQNIDQVNTNLSHIVSAYRFGKTGEEINQLILKQAEGSPYMDEEFAMSIILTPKNKVLTNLPLRYNIYNETFEIKLDTVISELNMKDFVKRARINNRLYDYLPYVQGRKNKEGILELVGNGVPFRLYCLHEVEFKEAEAPKAMQVEFKPPKFIKRPVVYYLWEDGLQEAIPIKNKKDFISALNRDKNKIETFIDDEKIHFNQIEDMKKLIYYCNSLQE